MIRRATLDDAGVVAALILLPQDEVWAQARS